MGICGRVVRVVDLESLSGAVCSNSTRDLGFFSFEEAIQLAYRTSVVLLSSLLVPEIMHEGAPEVFLYIEKLESRHVTFIKLVQRKT